MLKEIFTTEELEEMDHLRDRIALTLLMATAVINALPEYLDYRLTKEMTAS